MTEDIQTFRCNTCDFTCTYVNSPEPNGCPKCGSTDIKEIDQDRR